EGDIVGSPVLGAPRGQMPYPILELVPCRACYLIPPLAGQHQHTDERPIWIFGTRCPYPRKLLVRQYPISRHLFGRLALALARISFDQFLAHGEIEQAGERSEHSIGHHWCW